jgi:hypothetical protein
MITESFSGVKEKRVKTFDLLLRFYLDFTELVDKNRVR